MINRMYIITIERKMKVLSVFHRLRVHDKGRMTTLTEGNALGNNVGVYETAAIATPANPSIRALLEKSESPAKLFLSASISRNEHFPASSEWRRSFSTEKSVSSRCRLIAGKEGEREDSFRRSLLRARCVFAHSLAGDERSNSFRNERNLSHCSAPCRPFARRCAYARSADAGGNG